MQGKKLFSPEISTEKETVYRERMCLVHVKLGNNMFSPVYFVLQVGSCVPAGLPEWFCFFVLISLYMAFDSVSVYSSCLLCFDSVY